MRKPGFRFSLTDAIALIIGVTASIYAWQMIWWAGATVAFVFSHFFLFCNIFRIPRKPELIWAVSFITLATLSMLVETPSWIMTFSISLALSTALIIRQLFLPGYHGIGWTVLNPGLEGWKQEEPHDRNTRNG